MRINFADFFCCGFMGRMRMRTGFGKVAVSWLKILAANHNSNPNPNPTILSHETAT